MFVEKRQENEREHGDFRGKPGGGRNDCAGPRNPRAGRSAGRKRGNAIADAVPWRVGRTPVPGSAWPLIVFVVEEDAQKYNEISALDSGYGRRSDGRSRVRGVQVQGDNMCGREKMRGGGETGRNTERGISIGNVSAEFR